MIFAIKYTPFYVRISFTAKIKLTIRGLDAETHPSVVSHPCVICRFFAALLGTKERVPSRISKTTLKLQLDQVPPRVQRTAK